MKTLLTYLIFLLTFGFLFSQNIVRVTSSSETKHINLTKKESVVIDQDALKPVIHFLNPVFKEQEIGEKKVTSNIKLFNIKGITYAKDGSGIYGFFINDRKVTLNENDQFEETVILSPGSNQFVFVSNSTFSLSKLYFFNLSCIFFRIYLIRLFKLCGIFFNLWIISLMKDILDDIISISYN